MQNKYQLIVFDWDGTLANNLDNIVACKLQAAKELGIRIAEPDILRNVIGLSFDEAIRQSLPDYDEKTRIQFSKKFDELSQSNHYRETLFLGADTILKHLYDRKIKLAIVTSKSRKNLDKAMNDTKIGHLFIKTVCSEELKPKPDPAMLLFLIDQLQVSTSQVLMIGDSKTDMQMAMNAGVSAIGVAYGVGKKQELSAYPNIGLIDDIKELEQYI